MRVGRRTTAAARSPPAPTPTADSPAATATRVTCSMRGRAAAPRSPAVRAAMLSRFRRLQTIFLKQVSRFCSRGCDPAQRPYAARFSLQSGLRVPKVPATIVRTGGESAPCSGAFGQTCDFVCDDGELDRLRTSSLPGLRSHTDAPPCSRLHSGRCGDVPAGRLVLRLVGGRRRQRRAPQTHAG